MKKQHKLNELIFVLLEISNDIPMVAVACAGFLKGVGEESARNAGSEATAAGARGRSPRKIFNSIIC